MYMSAAKSGRHRNFAHRRAADQPARAAASYGRFMQPDPIGYGAGLNLYSYVGNDPVNRTDPLGLQDCPAWQCGGPINVWGSPVGSPGGGGGRPSGGVPRGARINEDMACVAGDPDSCWVVVTGRRRPLSTGAAIAANVNPTRIAGCYGPPPGPADVTPREMLDQVIANAAEVDRHSTLGFVNPFWFRDQVRTGGPWDYKQYHRLFEDFGNYNYGFTGAAGGFTLHILLVQAGETQTVREPGWGTPDGPAPFGDDPNDQRWIRMGYWDYYGNRSHRTCR